MTDLLQDPIFSVSIDLRRETVNLPQILALLSEGRDVRFSNLQRHWQHPWHAFLTQLGALAIARGGLSGLSTDPEEWRQALLSLTRGHPTAWTLVVEDLSLPAFMQPPMPGEDLESKSKIRTPDDFDIVMSAKNVDLKLERMVAAREEHWVYALTAKQTFSGFTGNKNYGICRQISRICVAFYQDIGSAARFRQDVDTWLQSRQEMIDAFSSREDGKSLLWLYPWDGKGSLGLDELDPFFIEICRRVRLQVDPQTRRLAGVYGLSDCKRIATHERALVFDIWQPQHRQDGVLRGTPRQFLFEHLSKMLFESEWEWPSKKLGKDRACWVVVQGVLFGGQKSPTVGYVEKIFHLPHGDLSHASSVAKQMLKWVSVFQKILDRALRELTPHGKNKRWQERFTEEVDSIFFDSLVQVSEETDDTLPRWKDQLFRIVTRVFEDALVLNPGLERQARASNRLGAGLASVCEQPQGKEEESD